MEKMTRKEQELLRELQAKAKRVKRAEDDFFKEADSRKNELLSRWGLSDIIGRDKDPETGDSDCRERQQFGED